MIERVEWRGAAYVALPDAPRGNLPWVLACHGSGRRALSYRDTPFYARQRDLSLASGRAFAACDMGPDTYGTPRGLEILNAFYEWMRENLPVTKAPALWASSAGGCAMFRFARAYPDRVTLMLGTFPVWDLSSVFHLQSMRAAWGGGDDAALADAIAPYNPAAHADALPGAPILICQGLRDKAVPPEKNALALKNALPERVSLFLTDDEHSTEAFSLYDTPLLADALRRRD